MNERLDTWSILFVTLLNDGILGFIGSAAITKSFGALTMSITQAHVPSPDQRASSWLSRDLVLYGRSFKSVGNKR